MKRQRRESLDEENIEQSDSDNCVKENSNCDETMESINCEHWDNDCVTLPKSSDIKHLVGCHLIPSCSRPPQLYPEKKIKLKPEIRCELQNKNVLSQLRRKWTENEEVATNGVNFFTKPFKICVINNFIQNSDILVDAIEEFNEIEWNQRHTDLYEFFQSHDLKHNNLENINKIYALLKTALMKWVVDVMGFDVVDMSATCSFYSNTDYLLVHDDQRGDRLVAFVLYLLGESPWSPEKGGALQLFESNEDGCPTIPMRDILPANNQLVLFPVGLRSHHQVTEVTTKEDCRFSINGWFHTKVPCKVTIPPSIKPIDGLFSDVCHRPHKEDIDLFCWINQDYLNTDAYSIINEQIENNSEICLKTFLREEPYQEITNFLTYTELRWNRVGPPDKFCYDVLICEDVPYILDRCLNLFRSDKMFALLKNYTDLDLASVRYEFQRWKPGYYALLTDYDWGRKNELDLIIFFNIRNTCDVIGGQIQYVTVEEEIQSALVTIEPEDNNLNIVYRDTARFTKYVGKQSRCREFYTLICSYSE